MRSILRFGLGLGLGLLASAGTAAAQAGDEPPLAPAAAPTAAAPEGERVVLPAKRLYAHAVLAIDLSDGGAFDPVSLSPDVYYGVTPELTVGLVHSNLGASGFIGGTGTSLCLGDACDGVYNNLGIDGRYHLKSGTVALAANFGLYVNDFDPFRLAVKLGAVGRYRPGPESKLAVDFAPSLSFGVTEREPAPMTTVGNKEVFALPVTVLYAAAPKITAMVQTGIVIPFEAAGDAFFVPLSLGGSYQIDKQLTVEAAFSLPLLLGGDALPATGIDARSFTIGGGYAF